MTEGRLHIRKIIAKMSQNLRNGHHLVSINPHGLSDSFDKFFFISYLNLPGGIPGGIPGMGGIPGGIPGKPGKPGKPGNGIGGIWGG